MTKLRIGTWNLEGRWSAEHRRTLDDLDCDLWLLTGVRVGTALAGYGRHVTRELMGPAKHWAGILSRHELEALEDPHPASAAVRLGEMVACSSVLPWPRAGAYWPWTPSDYNGRMQATIGALTEVLGTGAAVWGGDWNQPLAGNLAGFTDAGRKLMLDAVERVGLQVPTAGMPARNGVQQSIDHIAVPDGWDVVSYGFVPMPSRLSDHDPYWIEARTGN